MTTNGERISLERVSSEMRAVLANLLELYSHDLSDVFAIDVGADGRFGYPKLELYWSSPDSHYAFVFRYGGRIAGFALVTRGSPVIEDPSVLDVAEFFVLRRYRRVGVGRHAAAALWDTLTGRWVVRVSEANQAALTFWIDVVGRYTRGNFTEVTRDSSGHRWRVFSFDTASSGRSASRPT